jgi:hypothetical protein
MMNFPPQTMCSFWQNLSDLINSFISERSGMSFQGGTISSASLPWRKRLCHWNATEDDRTLSKHFSIICFKSWWQISLARSKIRRLSIVCPISKIISRDRWRKYKNELMSSAATRTEPTERVSSPKDEKTFLYTNQIAIWALQYIKSRSL